MSYKFLVNTGIGAIGSAIVSFFGGWTLGLIVLVSFVSVDFITGLMVALVFKKSAKTESGAYDSKVGWKGICKKVMIFILVFVTHMADVLCVDTGILPKAVLANWTIIAFCANEFGSIIENAGQMGFNLPAPVKKAFDLLNKKVGEKNIKPDNKAA